MSGTIRLIPRNNHLLSMIEKHGEEWVIVVDEDDTGRVFARSKDKTSDTLNGNENFELRWFNNGDFCR